MTLRVKILAEPFTEMSKVEEPILATSEEYQRLYRDLERYTRGLIQGRSYLIAGHRGSGKTMLVHKAIEDLLRQCALEPRRPLFVRLHGPDLLPHEIAPAMGAQKEKREEPKTPKTGANGSAEKGGSDTKTDQHAADGAAMNAELEIVLVQMVKALFRDVTNEFRSCYRRRVFELSSGLQQQRLLEIAAQFDLELTDIVTPSRLRGYWNRIDAFANGILFPGALPRLEYPQLSEPQGLAVPDAGLQEIVALSLLSQAYQVTSGKIEEKQKQTNAAKDERSSSISTAYALKNLFAPIAGLLSGGFVGIQIGMTNPLAAVLLGLLTGAVVSFAFTYSSSKSRSRETSLESVFIKDHSVATLSSILPLLVMRFRQIGLAPVFVIDELDKVHDLKKRMQDLVRHLKYLVTENSFTCFLSDRRYLTYLNRQAIGTAYAPEYTYFSDRILVLYSPDELRKFVSNALLYVEPEASRSDLPEFTADELQYSEDVAKLAYVILHRARLHPIDLRRQIDRLPARVFTFSDAFPSDQYRFEILMQLVIEHLLNGDDVKSQLGRNPDSRQIVYDALYYISRLWEDASETQLVPGFEPVGKKDEEKPGFVFNKENFSAYLEWRCAEEAEPGQPCDPPVAPPTVAPTTDGSVKNMSLGGLDFDFLFGKVSELLQILLNPTVFFDTLQASADPPPPYILNALPSEILLEKLDRTHYQWRYDFSGRYLEIREVDAVLREVDTGLAEIQETAKMLQTFGNEVNLQTMGSLRVIPRTPEWAVVDLALERLERLRTDQQHYDLINPDRDCIVEFHEKLRDYLPNVKAALMCAAALAPEFPDHSNVGDTGQNLGGTRLYASLVQVSKLLELSASKDDDLQKLTSALRERFESSDLKSPDWPEVLQFVKTSLAEPPDPTIADDVWVVFKTRFTRRFRDGTTHFQPEFPDLVTSLRDIGPGSKLSFDLSKTSAPVWSSFLSRSLKEPPDSEVPPWLRIAATLELNLPGLAEKLLATLPQDALLQQWVREFKLRPKLPAPSTGRSILLLTTEELSQTTTWKPSALHGALILPTSDFVPIAKVLKKHGLSKPADFLFDLVCLELPGDGEALGNQVTQKPWGVIADTSPSITLSDARELNAFWNFPEICYLVKETPVATTSAFRFVVAPKGLDELIEKLPPKEKSGGADSTRPSRLL